MSQLFSGFAKLRYAISSAMLISALFSAVPAEDQGAGSGAMYPQIEKETTAFERDRTSSARASIDITPASPTNGFLCKYFDKYFCD